MVTGQTGLLRGGLSATNAVGIRGSDRSILSQTLLREPPASPPKVAKPATNWREEADEAMGETTKQTY